MEELQLDAIRKQTKDVLRELMERQEIRKGRIVYGAITTMERGR